MRLAAPLLFLVACSHEKGAFDAGTVADAPTTASDLFLEITGNPGNAVFWTTAPMLEPGDSLYAWADTTSKKVCSIDIANDGGVVLVDMGTPECAKVLFEVVESWSGRKRAAAGKVK